MVEFYPDEQTEMRIADVRIPGVYAVRESGGGYTTEYIAQKLRARAGPPTSAMQRDDGSVGGGASGTAPGSGSLDGPVGLTDGTLHGADGFAMEGGTLVIDNGSLTTE